MWRVAADGIYAAQIFLKEILMIPTDKLSVSLTGYRSQVKINYQSCYVIYRKLSLSTPQWQLIFDFNDLLLIIK